MSLHTMAQGQGTTAFVLLHFLGGSGREWDEVTALLAPEFHTMTIDLPGFGGSAEETGYGVAAMAAAAWSCVE